MTSPWILFEAGALSKTLDRAFVCTYLIELSEADLHGPLVQFQATRATKDDTHRMVKTINNALGDGRLDEKRLDSTFEVWWPHLEKKITAVKDLGTDEVAPSPPRDEREILSEILELLRGLKREQPDSADSPRSDLKSKVRELNSEQELRLLQLEHETLLERKRLEHELEMHRQKLEFERQHLTLEKERKELRETREKGITQE